VNPLAKLRRNRKLLVASLASALVAVTAVLLALYYASAPLLKLNGNVTYTPLRVATIEINVSKLPSGTLYVTNGTGLISYAGKLGLLYNLTASGVLSGVVATWVPMFIVDKNMTRIYWTGIVLIINKDYIKDFTNFTNLKNLAYLIYYATFGMNQTPQVTPLNSCFIVNIYGRNVIMCPHNCTTPLSNVVCMVYAPKYPFYLPGNRTYIVLAYPHILTSYVYDREKFSLEITLYGYPTIGYNYVINVTKYAMKPIPITEQLGK